MGLFGISEDHLEKKLSLDQRFLLAHHSVFLFQLEGRAMEPALCEGDILVVDKSLNLSLGKIIIASVDGEFVCRYYVRERGLFILRAESSLYNDIILTSERDFICFGVVRAVARDLI